MNITPIRNDDDLREALAAITELMDSAAMPGTEDADRLDVLVTLVEAYETKTAPIGPPDPIEALKFRMEQAGLTPRDLVPLIGNTNRVYEVLNRTRPLTLRMIRNLHRELGIPAEALVA